MLHRRLPWRPPVAGLEGGGQLRSHDHGPDGQASSPWGSDALVIARKTTVLLMFRFERYSVSSSLVHARIWLGSPLLTQVVESRSMHVSSSPSSVGCLRILLLAHCIQVSWLGRPHPQ